MNELTEYEETDVTNIIADSIPDADPTDIFVFLMGPYRLLDPSYLYPDRGYPLPSDPLAPTADEVAPDKIEATLRTISRRVSEETATTAFIASDVQIPTKQEVVRNDLDELGMAVIDQSVAFAEASDGNAFIFTKAGLTTGTGAEAGAIPEHFQLRSRDDRERDPRTFAILAEAEKSTNGTNTYDPKFSSASIDEMDDAYDLRFKYFTDREDLIDKIVDFIESYVVPMSDTP
ncbi:DUF7509 family protein [Halorussus amylolyticus]|uniref:DUF7509 family protein n=1 Tax=Halorussus amylolyticus TaxID=1126242 RepID=UPI0010516F6E|nr:hypothetical protein [Halorussus amylolyticus]